MEIQAMDEHDAVSLLLKAAGNPVPTSSDSYAAAREVVMLLGAHTLAVIQAGYYVSKNCSLRQYPSHYQRARKRLLESQPTQAQSRYGTVYATFEASAFLLETAGDSIGETALELLGMIAYLHHSNVPLELFECAWVGARNAIKDPPRTQDLNLDSYSKDLINQLYLVLPINSNTWDPVDLLKAFARLDSLALVKIKRTDAHDQQTLISMHPLMHAWIRDRQPTVETQCASWLCTGALIALSAHDIVWNHWNSIWRTREGLLRQHIKSFVDNQRELDLSAISMSKLLQVEYRCVAILQRMRFDQHLEKYLAHVIDRTHLPLGTVLPLAKFRARNLADLGKFGESIGYWEYINVIEKEALNENDFVLLVSKHELGTAYLEGGRAMEAINIFTDIIPRKRQILSPDHDDVIASMHELGRAYLEVDRYAEAITQFEDVVASTARHFEPNHPDLLISRHELGRAYLCQDRVPEAISQFEQVIDMAVNRNLVPEDHVDLLVTKRQLALAHQKAGRLVEAIDRLTDIEHLQRTLPESHSSRLRTQSFLVEAYVEHNETSRAVDLLEYIINVRRSFSGTDSQVLLKDEKRLAELHHSKV